MESKRMYEKRKNPLHSTAHEDYRELCRIITSRVNAQKRRARNMARPLLGTAL